MKITIFKMKRVVLIFISLLICTLSYGQKLDYLSILNSLPPNPENPVASVKDMDKFKDELEVFKDYVYEYKNKFKDIEKKNYTYEELIAMEPLFKEFETINQYVSGVYSGVVSKWAELHNKCLEEEVALIMANEPYYKQINVLKHKPKNTENDKLIKELQKKMYLTQSEVYPRLFMIMSDFRKESLVQLKKLAPFVEQLDQIDRKVGYMISRDSERIGYYIFESYLKIVEEAFLFKLGIFEENIKDDWATPFFNHVEGY